MSEVTTIGLDIAKNVFHAHGADASGKPLFSRKISRTKLLEFFAKQPRCLVALEACGGAHHWARELTQQGHQVKLIPPSYVKPFVKRNKNDAVDAEAICEAAQRPNMRFVAIKSEEQQASALVFRTRDLLVRQRTQLINAIRGHLTEYGWVAPKGPSHIAVLGDLLDGEMGSSLPDAATPMFRTMLDLLEVLNGKIAELDKAIARRARDDVIARRLMTIPGVGPITATAIAALAPPVPSFLPVSYLPKRSRLRSRATRSRPSSSWVMSAIVSVPARMRGTAPCLAISVWKRSEEAASMKTS
jgi:transposase